MEHLLLSSPFTLRGWNQVLMAFGFRMCVPDNVVDWLEASSGWSLKGKARFLGCVIHFSVQGLWKERSRRIFEDKSFSFESFCNNVQITSLWCLRYKKFFCNCSLVQILHGWQGCASLVFVCGEGTLHPFFFFFFLIHLLSLMKK